jgi:hypothetical protein
MSAYAGNQKRPQDAAEVSLPTVSPALFDRPRASDLLLKGANHVLGLSGTKAVTFLVCLSQDFSLATDPGNVLIAQRVPVGHEECRHLLPLGFDFRPVHGWVP